MLICVCELNATAVYVTARNQYRPIYMTAYTNNPEEGPDELSKWFIWPGTWVEVEAIGEGCFPLLFLVVDAKIKVRVD